MVLSLNFGGRMMSKGAYQNYKHYFFEQTNYKSISALVLQIINMLIMHTKYLQKKNLNNCDVVSGGGHLYTIIL